MEDPVAIATFFMYKSLREGMSIDSIKVTKLSVIAHGYYLALHGLPLLAGGVQISSFGLIVMRQILYFQGYFRNDPARISKESVSTPLLLNEHDKVNVIQFLTYIWETHKRYKSHHLTALLNLPSQPWYIMQKHTKESPLDVPDNLLLDFFKNETNIVLKADQGLPQ